MNLCDETESDSRHLGDVLVEKSVARHAPCGCAGCGTIAVGERAKDKKHTCHLYAF